MSRIPWRSQIARGVDALIDELRKTKRMAEGAFGQLEDEDFFFKLNPQQNSIFVIVKHLSGNMLSRWTDGKSSCSEVVASNGWYRGNGVRFKKF